MCATIRRHRETGKRKSLIIVAEGAIDRSLNPIQPEYIKELLSKKVNVDTRVTTLGHVQRGGSPAFIDRYLATLQGVKAVDAVLGMVEGSEAPMIGASENKISVVPLVKAVEMVKKNLSFLI